MDWLYKDDKKKIYVFLIGCTAGFLCALPFISNLIYSIDDYHLWNVYDLNWENMGYNFYSTGRVVEGIIAEIFYKLNLQPLNRPIGMLIFIVALSIFGTLIGELLDLKDIILSSVICLLVVLNPFNTEIFYYSNITVYSGFAIIFLTMGFLFSYQYLMEKRKIKLLYSCVFYCLSLGVYQIFYPMVFFLILLMIIRDYNEGAVKWKRYAVFGGVYFFSFLLFYILLKIMFKLMPPTLIYDGIDIIDFTKRLFMPDFYIQLFNILKKYYGNTILHSALALGIIVIGTVIVSVYGFFSVEKKWREIYFVGVLLYIFLGPIMCLGLGLARLNEISARSFTSYGIYLSGLLVIDYYYFRNICKRETKNNQYRKIGVVFFSVICLVNGGLMGKAANNIMRLNTEEANMVNRIVYRMEEHEEFTGYEPLVILGVPMLSNMADKSLGNLGQPASVSFSKVLLFNEVSGYSFILPNEEQWEKAAEVATDMTTWPNKDSVVYVDGMFVVRLYW